MKYIARYSIITSDGSGKARVSADFRWLFQVVDWLMQKRGWVREEYLELGGR